MCVGVTKQDERTIFIYTNGKHFKIYVTTLMHFCLSNRDLVTEEGSSWILKETGICITFTPNAVPTPIMVTSSLWRPGIVLPPLKDDETLVSNIIELACDDPVADIEFSKVTVTLSHSATDLRGYELVLKERIDAEQNIWKDLDTCFPLGRLLYESKQRVIHTSDYKFYFQRFVYQSTEDDRRICRSIF